MNVSEILKRCSHLTVEGECDISEDFVERVFFKKDIGAWEKVLTDILGPALKKAGEVPTQLFCDLTVNYGGILDDQTLFYKKFEGYAIIAVFWPWKDNNQVTLKIACIKE